MARKKVLITVTTYPLPSRSYDELVCTAGFLENGEWIRIYPVPLSFLIDLKGSGKVKTVKYTWIELDLQKRTDDFRPESYSPVHYDFKDMTVGETVDTKGNWLLRKDICLRNIYTNKNQLLEDSKDPTNVSLATFKPAKILGLDIEEDEREWKDVWLALRKQTDMFTPVKPIERLIPKPPYKFFYRFRDDAGDESRLMIEDWEIGALYWKCLRDENRNDKIALEKVRQKYEEEFIRNRDIFLFMGTTKEWHMRRSKNPFVIVGVFYPKIEHQGRLF